VGPMSGSVRDGEQKSSCPCRESNPSRPARGLVTVLTGRVSTRGSSSLTAG